MGVPIRAGLRSCVVADERDPIVFGMKRVLDVGTTQGQLWRPWRSILSKRFADEESTTDLPFDTARKRCVFDSKWLVDVGRPAGISPSSACPLPLVLDKPLNLAFDLDCATLEEIFLHARNSRLNQRISQGFFVRIN